MLLAQPSTKNTGDAKRCLWTHSGNRGMALQVLIDPPWEEYARRAPGAPGLDDAWPWQDIQALDIAAVADTPSFVFLWCFSPCDL